MNGRPLNQQPTAAPLPPPPVRGAKVKWLILVVVILVGIIGVLSFLRRGQEPVLPPPPAESQAAVDDVLQGFGGLTPGNSPAEIQQDIEATDIQALDAELEALERELQGL